MTKNYQKKNASRATSDELALPDAVSVAMADIAGSVGENGVGMFFEVSLPLGLEPDCTRSTT